MGTLLKTLAAALLMSTTACGTDGTTVPTTTGTAATTTVPSTEPVTTPPVTEPPTTTPGTLPGDDEPDTALYFVLGEQLVVVGRSLGAPGPEAALRALLEGPNPAEVAAGIGTEIPDGTGLLGIDVSGNEVTVDLTGSYGSGGGSLSMFLRLGEVLFTATQFEGIDTVRFRLDGVLVESIGGEGLLVDHATRVQFADAVAPMIVLDSPLPGASLVEPITMRGMSNTFEAVINYQVLDAGGRLVLESRCQATSGTGTWGTFDCTLPPLPEGTGSPVTLRVFEYSPMDGAPINVVEVVLD